jgi:FkbM family methyltransferase
LRLSFKQLGVGYIPLAAFKAKPEPVVLKYLLKKAEICGFSIGTYEQAFYDWAGSIKVTGREALKSVLKATGVFPVARHMYRRVLPKIRRQRRREISFYREIIKPGDLCFDVGANLGQKSDVLLAIGARVVLLEPNSNCDADLNFQFKDKSSATIVRAAVGPREGTIKIYANGSGAAASVDPNWNKRLFGDSYVTTAVEVPMTTLNRLIQQFGRPDYIKIDIEGYEEEALKGLSVRVPVVSFEFFHQRPVALFNCLELLSRFGPIQFRFCDMDCNWLSDAMVNAEDAVRDIQSRKIDGDMFVWIS